MRAWDVYKCREYVRGISLLEVVIYLAILSVIFTFTVSQTLGLYDTVATVHVSRDVNGSAIVSLDRITHEIREAESINEDVQDPKYQGTQSEGLALYYFDELGVRKEVYIYSDSSSRLVVERDGSTPVPLVATHVKVERVMFTKINTGNSQAVRVELSLSGSKQGVDVTRDFNHTVVLRGSY